MSVVLPNEVFLSHSSLDRQFAGDLSAVISRHGVPVWYSQTNILGAQHGKMRSGPRFSDVIGLPSSSRRSLQIRCG